MGVHDGHRDRLRRKFAEHGLDPFADHEVLELLLSVRAELNQTLIIVTHDPAIADRADRILRMDNGVLSVWRGERGQASG